MSPRRLRRVVELEEQPRDAREGYLTVEQAAAYLHLTIPKFNNWVYARKITPDGRIGRRRLYRPETIDRIVAAEGPNPFWESGHPPTRTRRPGRKPRGSVAP